MRGSLIQRECILFISIIGKEKMPIVEREKPTISYADVTASIVAKEVLTPNLGASKSKVEIGNVRSKYLFWIQKLRNAGSKLEQKLILNQESVLHVLEQQDKLTEVIEENLKLLKSKWKKILPASGDSARDNVLITVFKH